MKNNKFPTWDEAILGITDPRLKDEVYSNLVRHYVGVGARIMYDRLYSMLPQDAILTSAMHSDGEGDAVYCGGCGFTHKPSKCPDGLNGRR